MEEKRKAKRTPSKHKNLTRAAAQGRSGEEMHEEQAKALFRRWSDRAADRLDQSARQASHAKQAIAPSLTVLKEVVHPLFKHLCAMGPDVVTAVESLAKTGATILDPNRLKTNSGYFYRRSQPARSTADKEEGYHF